MLRGLRRVNQSIEPLGPIRGDGDLPCMRGTPDPVGRSPMNSATTAAVPIDIPATTTITPGPPRAPLGLGAPSGGGDAGCGAALSGEAGPRRDGWWGGKAAADLLDDALQVVHVLGEPAGHLGVVTAAALGAAHRQADREQLLDDVVAHVPFLLRRSVRLRWPWFGSARPSPAQPIGIG